MKKQLLVLATTFSLFASMASPVFAADDVPVKPVRKSVKGVCHPPTGLYYDKVKRYTPYENMAECVASGGTPAKK